ncbi:MAG TPA: hypothetical protein VGK33_16860 [Chloroflexota bacterium]
MGWLVEVWKAYAHRAGAYQTRVLLTLVYLIVLGPAAFVGRLFGAHLMDLSATGGSTWLERPAADKSLAAQRRQF